MAKDWREIARATLEGSDADTMTFSEGVKMLMEGGFDGYTVDLRRGTRTYYLASGELPGEWRSAGIGDGAAFRAGR
jgi:hypothetical protein